MMFYHTQEFRDGVSRRNKRPVKMYKNGEVVEVAHEDVPSELEAGATFKNRAVKVRGEGVQIYTTARIAKELILKWGFVYGEKAGYTNVTLAALGFTKIKGADDGSLLKRD